MTVSEQVEAHAKSVGETIYNQNLAALDVVLAAFFQSNPLMTVAGSYATYREAMLRAIEIKKTAIVEQYANVELQRLLNLL